MADATHILHTFIADEDAAMQRGEQGDYYIQHHYEIVPLIPRAGRLLDDDGLVSFYFHLLRLNIIPAVKREQDYELLRAAYEALTPLMDEGWPLCSLQRTGGLLLFGHDGKWALAAQPPHALASYMVYRKVWAHVNAYVSMPTMMAKKQRFQPYTEDQHLCLRILYALRGVRYLADESDPLPSLWFWGLVFILVIERRLAEAVLADMTGLMKDSAKGRGRLATLRRYLAAAGWEDLAAGVDALLAAAEAA